MLAKYDDDNFRHTLEVGSGVTNWATSRAAYYRELQLHGQLEFAKDIATVVVAAEDAEGCGKDKIVQWAHANGIDVVWKSAAPPAESGDPLGNWECDPAPPSNVTDRKTAAAGAAAGAGGVHRTLGTWCGALLLALLERGSPLTPPDVRVLCSGN